MLVFNGKVLQVCSIPMTRQSHPKRMVMNESPIHGIDQWLSNLHAALQKARTRAEIEAVMDNLEDHYDAFSGPGQDLVEAMMERARQRLKEFQE